MSKSSLIKQLKLTPEQVEQISREFHALYEQKVLREREMKEKIEEPHIGQRG